MSDSLREALIDAADELYAAYAGFARTDGQCEAMTNYSAASNAYRAALSAPQADAEAVALYQCELDDGRIEHFAGCFGEVQEVDGVRVVKRTPLYTAPPSQSAEMRRALEIVRRMIKGKLIEASIVDMNSMKSLREVVEEALSSADEGKESEGGHESSVAPASGSGPLPTPHIAGDACSAIEPPRGTETVGRHQELKRAAGVAPGPSDPTPPDRREAIARIIYDAFPFYPPCEFNPETGERILKPAWVDNGNSIRQDDARRAADAILALLRGGES